MLVFFGQTQANSTYLGVAAWSPDQRFDGKMLAKTSVVYSRPFCPCRVDGSNWGDPEKQIEDRKLLKIIPTFDVIAQPSQNPYMPIFSADKKNYRNQEIKRWIWGIISILILYACFKFFSNMRTDTSITGCISGFLAMLTNSITPYRLNVIQINNEKHKVNFRFKSIISGYEYKAFDLAEVTSELIEKKSWITFNRTSLRLKIFLPGKKMLYITNRYGYTNSSLRLIHETLNKA